MKISPIIFSNITRNQEIKTGAHQKKSPVYDVFIKSNSINFTSQNNFASLFDKFKTEISDYILNSQEINISDMEAIFKKYLPNLEVKNIKEYNKENDIKSCENFIIQNYNVYNNGSKVTIDTTKNTLYTNIPQKLDEKSRTQYLCSILHEGVHALWESSTDKQTRIDTINSFLNSKHQDAQKVCTSLEELFGASLNAELMVSSFLPVIFEEIIPEEDEIVEPVIDILCQEYLGNGLKNYCQSILMKYITDTQKQIEMFGKNNVLNYLINILNEEIVAYTKSHEEISKIKNPDKIFDGFENITAKTRVVFYRELAKQAENEKTKNIYSSMLSKIISAKA